VLRLGRARRAGQSEDNQHEIDEAVIHIIIVRLPRSFRRRAARRRKLFNAERRSLV